MAAGIVNEGQAKESNKRGHQVILKMSILLTLLLSSTFPPKSLSCGGFRSVISSLFL